MTVEIRVTAEDGSYEQYTVARKPVTDPRCVDNHHMGW